MAIIFGFPNVLDPTLAMNTWNPSKEKQCEGIKSAEPLPF